MNTNLFPPYFWQRIFTSTIYFQQTMTPSIIHLMQIGVFFSIKLTVNFKPLIFFTFENHAKNLFLPTIDETPIFSQIKNIILKALFISSRSILKYFYTVYVICISIKFRYSLR